MVLATVVVLVVRHRQRVFSELADARLSHLGIGVVLGFISCVFIIALEVTTVAFVLLLQTFAPIAAAYFSWVLMGERVSRQALVATAVSVAGISIMFSGAFSSDLKPAAFVAVFLPIGFGLYATLVRSAERINPAIPLLTAGVTVVVTGGLVVALSGGFTIDAADAYIGIFAGSFLLGFPMTVFNVAQRVVPAPETALILMSEVVLAPIWAWLFVAEVPVATTLIGGGVVLGAVIWLTLSRQRHAS
jgi:DME family drug/metabolite transporter